MITIQENIDLLPYNTFQVSCIAKYFVVIESVEAMQELIKSNIRKTTERKLILGGGSNMLFVSPIYDGIVVKNEIRTIRVKNAECRTQSKEENATPCWNNYTLITVWAWENWDEFVRRTIKNGYYGIENLVSIPGTVWASPVQNIGAYGVEVESVIDSVTRLEFDTWLIHTYCNDACKFWYRSSIFKQWLKWKGIITHVTFKLKCYNSSTYAPTLTYGAVLETIEQSKCWGLILPTDVATTIAHIRSEKLPDRTVLWTAWSFFKNPIVDEERFLRLQQEFWVKGREVPKSAEIRMQNTESEKSQHSALSILNCTLYKLSAWQLIDVAWLKGYRQWDIGVYEKHALVLVNYGEKDGSKFAALIERIQQKVEGLFGVKLELEVNVL